MLVTIQLPCNFAVAHLGEVQVMDLKPRFERSAFAVDAIGMPVDLSAVIQPFISKQIEAVFRDAFSTLNDLAGCFGKKLAQFRTELGNLLRGKKELPRRARDQRPEARLHAGSCFEAPIVHAGSRLLA